MKYLSLVLLICLSALNISAEEKDSNLTMLVGTYTGAGSNGIYSMRFNEDSGDFTMLDSAKVANPSYLTLSHDNKYVYAVSEGGKDDSKLNAFKFSKRDGKFKFLNSVSSQGSSPCYVSTVDNAMIVANYGDGVLSVFNPLYDGKLLDASQTMKYQTTGPVKGRQDGAHLHCAVASPDMKYLFATNLGGDCIYQYWLFKVGDEVLLRSSDTEMIRVAPGSGPRHLIFSPNGQNAYLISEIGGTVTAFHYDGNTLNEFQTVQVDSLKAAGSGDIHISPDGRYLYASNRLKGDGIAIMQVADDGSLTKCAYQDTKRHPRNFIITPNGKYLLVACRDDNTIQIFKINIETGLLEDTGKAITLSKPVCIKFAN